MLNKLGQVCNFYSGTGFPVIYQGKDSGELPFYKVGDIAANVTSGNTYLSFCSNFISRQEAAELRGTIIPQNTVVFAKIGEALKLNRRAITSCDCLIDNNAMGIAPKEDVLRVGYFFYYMKYLKMQDYAESTTVPSVRKSKLEQIGINVPYLDEQKTVEERLNLISDIILKREQELQRLDDLIKARFVEMFGDPVYNEKEWLTMPLDDICHTIVDCPHSTPSYTFEDTGYMCIRTSIVKKNKILWDEIEYIPEEEYKKRIQRKKPEKGDVIYTREGAILGIAAVIDRDCNVALGQRSMLLSPNKEYCTPEFLSVAMNFDSFLASALKGMSGSASPHINVGDIKAFKMILPPTEKQKHFSVFVSQVDKSKVEVQKSLDEAQLLFDSLMQQYFG